MLFAEVVVVRYAARHRAEWVTNEQAKRTAARTG